MKFLAIDGNGLVNRAFYGVKLLTNRVGQPTNAIHGFLNTFLKLTKEIKPDYIAVAFDVKAPTFRVKRYAEYKATRQPTPNELLSQMKIIKEILKLMGCAVIEKPGFEADDILGTLATFADTERDLEMVIVTGDTDILQLVNEKVLVRVIHSQFKTTVNTNYNVATVVEKYNVAPKQLIDLKALMGDSSDNIPGARGIGKKIAVSLISKYHDVENIYDNLEFLDEKVTLKNKLIASKESVFLSKDLATICTCVPINMDLEQYKVSDQNNQVNQNELLKLLTQLELFSVIKKLGLSQNSHGNGCDNLDQLTFSDVNNKSDGEKQSLKHSLQDVNLSQNDLTSQIKNGLENLKSKKIYILVEHDDSFILSIDDNIFSGCDKFVALDLLYQFFDDKPDNDFELFTHEAKKIHSEMLSKYGKTFCFKFDTEIAGYLLNSDFSDHELSKLFSAYCDNSFDFDFEKIKDKMLGFIKLCDIMDLKIKENNLEFLLSKVELPLSEVLADMELTGFEIDQRGLILFGEKLDDDIESLKNQIYELAGCEFNINSSVQLSKVLFEVLGLPTRRKNKTGYSTSVDVLNSLRDEHVIINKITDYRLLNKLKNTYVNGLLKAVKKDNKIHSSFKQTETRTGRISSEKPNIQNIPIRTHLGSQLRNFFVAQENHTLIDGDYSQIELRILASMADDHNMINAFKNNQDIHAKVASEVFNVSSESVTPEMRLFAKSVNFGIIYGISSFSLAEDLNISVSMAKKYIDSYFGKFSNIKKYFDKIVDDACRNGFVTTLFGRRRNISGNLTDNKNKAMNSRIARNTPIQGTAADIIKIAMVNVYKRLKSEKLKSKLILQIHDELIIESPVEEVEVAKNILEQEMKNAASLKVDLKVDIGIGDKWLEAHHI